MSTFGVDRDPANAVRIAIAAFNYIRKLLEEDNLLMSEKKTGFIVSNSAAEKLLAEQLPKHGPKVHDVMRDLGVDCTGGRLRRIRTMQARRQKANRKTKKLQMLKIPQRAIRLRLCKGSILSSISWGQGHGTSSTTSCTAQGSNGPAAWPSEDRKP